jgi:UDP-N-acetylglucosamine pyrophosphorylase
MIQYPAVLGGLKMNKDKSLTIKLETREMSSEEVGMIADLANKECWVGMSEVKIDKLDIPEEITEFKGEKSLSERLRNTLYVYWEKVEKDKAKNPFESFRKIKMEQFIQAIKDKIPE